MNWKEIEPVRTLRAGRNRIRQLKERRVRAALEMPDTVWPRGASPCLVYHSRLPSETARLLLSALGDALSDKVDLPAAIRDIPGMSGQQYRSFINRLVHDYRDPRYLEIGSWMGSSVASALYGNKAKATCVDNWSLFGGPKREFFDNVEKVRTGDIELEVLEQDFRILDFSAIGSFNIYFFDGPHGELDQYDGIVRAQPALAHDHILIVDDWNWVGVRLGTIRGLYDAGCSVVSSIEIRTTLDNSHPAISGNGSEWHNGYFIAEVTKRGS